MESVHKITVKANAPGITGPLDSPGSNRNGSGMAHIPDYELLRRIGHGAYGEVWLARGVTGIFRAVKIVLRDRFEDNEPFEREFRGVRESMAHSQESGQLALHHVGQDDTEGFFYYVMDLADDATTGQSIEPERYVPLTLKELKARRGRLPAGECVAIGIEVARTLAALHARGLVHRDVKPSNIVLVKGVPRLADVGLVSSSANARTLVGTQGYLPPEGPGTPAGDVYALGKVLYELATGLDREEFPKLPEHASVAADPQAFFGLNKVILRACEPKAEHRYRNAGMLLADLETLRTGRAVRSSARWLWTAGVAALVALAAVGAWQWWTRRAPAQAPPPPPPAISGIHDKSIAVLPFTNMSDDRANAYFADGVQEDIIANLAGIRELRVVSRTSVMSYRDTTKPIREIAQQLGVAYILEGSVRRAGDRVRVSGQLIDAATDEHLWARTYDRDLTDIFAIQSELSQEIARALSAALSAEEKQRLDRLPTDNPTAYDDFLKARDTLNNALVGNAPALRQAEGYLKTAVQRDPEFAVAWGGLANVHARFSFYGLDASPERLAAADAAIAEAERLAPDDPAVIESVAEFAYLGHRDFEGATRRYEKLAELRPNDVSVFLMLGASQRRLGRWSESLASLRRAFELDPGNHGIMRELCVEFICARRWDELRAIRRRVLTIARNKLREELETARMEFSATGSLQAADDLMARLTPAEREAPVTVFYRKAWAIYRGDYAEFKQLDRRQPVFEQEELPAVAAVDAGAVYFAMGDSAALEARIAGPLADLRAQVRREPSNFHAMGLLAILESLAGNTVESVRLVSKAAAIAEARDVPSGNDYRFMVAAVFALTGDKERAIDALTHLFSVPSIITVEEIRASPAFIKLRGDPRFEALLNDPKNKAQLF